ncbi:MAG: PaaI family thioesterase [Thermoleophilaceae bacterium]
MLLKAGGFGHAVCCGRRRRVETTESATAPRAALPESSPFSERGGLKLVALEEGRATVTLPVREESSGADGRVHRGAITALVEAAASAAALGAVDSTTEDGGASELHVIFVRPAPQHPLNAEARVVSRDGARRSCEVEVRDWNGELVAKGFLSCRV